MKTGTIENKHARTHTQTHTTDSIRAYIDSCLICRHMSQAISFSWAFFFPYFQCLYWLNVSYVLARLTHVSERERERERERYTSVFVCVCVICVGSFENYDSERDRARQTLILSYVLARLTQVSDRNTHTECVLSQVNKLKKNHIRWKLKKKMLTRLTQVSDTNTQTDTHSQTYNTHTHTHTT